MPSGIPKNGINIGRFKKGHFISEKIKKKISKGLKGRIPWNKEKKLSEETRRKMKLNRKGMFGKHHTEETKKKMSEIKKGKRLSSRNDGINFENRRIRQTIEFRLWRESVFARDNWTCQKCKIKSGNGKAVYLHPHHIKNFAQYSELRFALDNGITFCKKCHRKFHKKYGFRNNAIEQIEEFLNN